MSFIIKNCKVNAYCSTTTALTTTIDPNRNFNRVKTIIFSIKTSTINYILTTIPYNTCEAINGSSSNYGVKDYFFSKQFSIQFSDLASIVIYGRQSINAVEFNFLNQTTETYGHQVGKKILIDLKNKEVKAINIRSNEWINNIQFLIYDPNENSFKWSQSLSNQNGYLNHINAENVDIHAKNFTITTISGSSDSNLVNEFQFDYNYLKCNPFIPSSDSFSVPILPPTTTTILTTAIPTTTATIAYGKCEIKNGRSDVLGKIGTLYFTMPFEAHVSELKCLEIYSGDFVYAFNFTFHNGSSELCGNCLSKNIKKKKIIDLINKQIIAVNIRSGWWINSIQFLIYDLLNNTYTWTDPHGGQGGYKTSFNAQNLAPLSSDFYITSLSGFANPAEEVRTLSVKYSYKLCNPAAPGATIPLTPAFSVTTTIVPFIKKSTHQLEDNYNI